MNKDDEFEAVSDDDGNRSDIKSLNSSLDDQEFSVQSSSVAVGDLKLKISYRKKSNDDQVDYSLGANLRNPPVLVTSDKCLNDGTMDAQCLKSSTAVTGEELAVTSENAVNSSGYNPLHFVKGCHGPAIQSGLVKENAGAYVDVCEAAKTSDSLKPVKNIKSVHTSTCRSSIQDVQDSNLRMDILPNVSPDSGIVSFEGSPFGNESPHSIPGVEHAQEPNLLQVNCAETAKSVKADRNSEVSKIHESSALPVEHEQMETSEVETQSVVSSVHCAPSIRLKVDVHVGNPEVKASVPGSKRHSEEADVLGRQFYKSLPSAESEPVTTDIILSSPTKISPSWKKKKGNSVKKKKFQVDHKRSILYNNVQGKKTQDIPARNISFSEDSLDKKRDNINDANGNKVDVVHRVCEIEPSSLDKPYMVKDVALTKRSPGRPKGSLNKVFEYDPPRRTYRKHVPKLAVDENVEAPLKEFQPSNPKDKKIKRPRGRPRKFITFEQSNLPPKSNSPRMKKKKVRKRIYTRLKKTTVNKPFQPASNKRRLEGIEFSMNVNADNLFKSQCAGTKKSSVFHDSSSKLFSDSRSRQLDVSKDLPSKKGKEILHGALNSAQNGKLEKSDFSDKDLEALLKSVKSSIHSQFTPEKDSEEIASSISFDNPFKSIRKPSFPQLPHSHEVSSVRPKPKYKKPKLHVMMRKTKRKKRKKLGSAKPVTTSAATSPDKGLSFFTSRVQPSKLLASSRLNVFHTGTGVESNRSGTPTDGEQTEGSEKRLKKRRKLLNFKSKHKNIIDPVFAADLDLLESGLKGLGISENPADNYIRVRPGEMPLPLIFRVIKIDVMKRMKEKMILEPNNLDACKPMKSTKKEMLTPEVVSPLARNFSKTVRKKSSIEVLSDSKDQTSLSDSSDQWLPPKKRHRMVHIDNLISQPTPSNSTGFGTLAAKESSQLSERKKARRQRKTEGESSLNRSRNLDQVLTIDTSSYSTTGSSVSTLTPSPCPSRQSTRSSTVLSISSLSPSESTNYHSKHNLKQNNPLTCSHHSLGMSTQEDYLSCAECQLNRRSALMSGIFQSSSSLPRSLSNTSVDPNSFGHSISSSEPSPSLKCSKTNEESSRRSTRKRRKSSNYSMEDAESSPPCLERHSIISPSTHSPDVYSTPPEITPIKKIPSSPRLTSSNKPSTCSQTFSSSGDGISQRSMRHTSFRSVVSDKQLCNTSSYTLSQSSTSPSVIPELTSSDWQPLPLEYCRKKELVEEIQAALHLNSVDDSSSECERGEEEPLHPSASSQGAPAAQPPRKRYQRVGLFSDFYKDDEPRKRCENMIRCRDKLVYVKDEHEYGLMPLPIHVGLYYMTQVQDYQLPYDIWWQVYHDQLPKKSESKAKFRTLRSNVYVDGKTSCRKKEIPACNCRPPPCGGMGCLDDCLNRMIYTECSMPNCPLGDSCGNQRIQKHDWAPGIEKFATDDRGVGVRVTKPVKTGQFILEYLGEVVSEIEFRRRMMEEYSEECHHYALHLDSGDVIDGYRMGNIGRYVNHSCQPNCEMQKWNVNGLYRMVLVALRDINAFEELGYDYNFDAFNQDTQQECRCGSEECRGVIGGKAQRNNGLSKHERMSDDPKDKRKSKLFNKKAKEKKQMAENVQVIPPTRTMTPKERSYARKHSMFLVRNVDRVLNQRHPGQIFVPVTKEEVGVTKVNCVTSDVLLANLTESSVKTRLASFAKDNPEVVRRHQLAQLFDKILTELLSLKDQEGNSMVTPLMSLPSRKKQPQYYQVVKEPVDMSIIKQRVKTGHYDHLKSFIADIMLLFSNVELYCGPKSDMGQVILKLRHIFNCAVQDLSSQIDEVLGAGTTKVLMDFETKKLEEAGAKVSKEPEEDIIRCICGVTRDEGLMLQCEKCMRWQHCDCVRASGKEEHYLCDRCEPRYYDPEILLAPPLADSLPDCTHFMTLVKDDMQYAVGDCVYVMRDCKRSATGTPLRASHRLIASSNPDSLDIFRIDQLWKDPKGERFVSGTPYLRPQETFHEPTRKFLHNELFRTPNYEIIPLELVMGKAVVMDPTTYCKGRPRGVKEQDVYVCEYRVDKTAHLFHKIKEIWYPINTSRFCFDWFETKLSLKRTFAPHEIPEEYRRKAERNSNSGKGNDVVDKKPDTKKGGKQGQILHDKVKMDESLKHDIKLKAEVKVNVKKGSDLKREVKLEGCSMIHPNVGRCSEIKRQEKRERLDQYCLKLLNSIPGKQKVDLSYLLDGGRRVRKKLIK